MFSASTYSRRRNALLTTDTPQNGIVVLLGNGLSAMNYSGNPYPFRQDSTFLYYFGVDIPDVDGVIDLDEGSACLYGDDPDLDEIVWTGERPSTQEYANRVGVDNVSPRSALLADVTDATESDRPVHFLPPYRESHALRLESLTGIQRSKIDDFVSTDLLDTVVEHRSVKSTEEINEIGHAVSVTARMHRDALRRAEAGKSEREIFGHLEGVANAYGQGLSFRPTCSIRGEILHNHGYSNELSNGDLLLVDAGASSLEHYAGDITRVFPVGGSFTSRQKELYQAVLDTQTAAIDAIAPGVPFIDIHRRACRVLTEHLIDLGLMDGRVDDAVAKGAHALFFPHGLGHMLGLDAHDMENLGEDRVGYAEEQSRSEQFGLHTLRLARPLRTGFVVTVEPGCYFIPELIQQWREEKRHADFINYDTVSDYEGFGGIRIEDDVLVTDEGGQILGPEIPKTVSAVESAMNESA